MNTIKLLSLFVAVFLSMVTVYADYLIKKASLATGFTAWPTLLLGMTVYGLTGLGWFFVMRSVKLSTLGVVYGLTCIIVLTLLSVIVFKEKIHSLEMVGIAFALLSLVLLARFA